MGLRINTNISSVTALRNLRLSDRAQQKSLERLSTGLRINSAADDPSGLVISERLRAQIDSLKQAKENTQRGSNLLQTADSALQEAENLLSDIKDSIIFSLNTGTGGLDQIQAEQDSVDQAVEAINRIAKTTRFAGKELLNGNSGFFVKSTVDDLINNLNVRQMEFAQGVSSRDVSVEMTQSAQRGLLSIANGPGQTAVKSGDVTVRITGPRGSEDVVLNSGDTASQVRDALNNKAGETGLFASAVEGSAMSAITGGTTTSSQVLLMSDEFGSEANVKLEVIDSDSNAALELNGDNLEEGDARSDFGQDPKIKLNGQEFKGSGRDFKIVSSFGNLEFDLDPDNSLSGVFQPNISTEAAPSGDTADFSVTDSGLQFQLGGKAQVTDRIQVGITSVASAEQGFEQEPDFLARAISGDTDIDKGGFLNSLKSGNDNDLTTNPENALKIVDSAIRQLTRARGHLGAVDAFNFQPNQDHLGVAIENLTSSESDIRDLDFAAESAKFAQNQVKFQAGTAVLASANSIPQSVLSLLQGG